MALRRRKPDGVIASLEAAIRGMSPELQQAHIRAASRLILRDEVAFRYQVERVLEDIQRAPRAED
jgi:hypothetical protein